MTDQLTLLDHALQPSLFTESDLPHLTEPEYLPGLSLHERFVMFHDANPQVYAALRRLALDLVRRGRTRIGIGMLYEVLRWNSLLVTRGEAWRLNNDYRSRYARLLASSEPELGDAFETRELKA